MNMEKFIDLVSESTLQLTSSSFDEVVSRKSVCNYLKGN